MQSLVVGDLRIEAVMEAAAMEGPPVVRLKWTGKSNSRHPGEVLTPYFRDALAAAGARKVPIELRFEQLEHFNSSTITAIIQLIQDARARSIKLILVYDQALKWQKLSFDALRVFARDDLLELRAS
jgi:hypothetical protein